MKFPLTLLLFIATVPFCLAQRTIMESEDMRFIAQVKRDTVALKNLLGDDLWYTHSNALTDSKTSFIKSIQTGHITYESIRSGGPRMIRQYERGNIGISNGTIHVIGHLAGEEFQLQLCYTAVYAKQNRIWRLVSWQSTKIP